MHTSTAAVLHVFDAPPVVVALQSSVSDLDDFGFMDKMKKLTAPLFAGLHAFANTLKNGVDPSAVLASATLLM